MEIRYESSWFAPCRRPVLRCWTGAEILDQPLVGAILGRATTIVFVPAGVRRIAIRAPGDDGAEGFRVTEWRKVVLPSVLLRALRNDAGTALETLGARVFGGPEETRQILRAALGGSPPGDQARWWTEHYRPLDVLGFDRPRSDWAKGPRLHVVLAAGQRDREEDGKGDMEVAPPSPYPHVTSSALDAGGDLADDDLVVVVPSAARLRGEALPLIAEAAMRQPEASLFYGDEILGEPGHGACRFRLRPDWHPLDGQRLVFGRDLVAVRAGVLRRSRVEPSALHDAGMTAASVLGHLDLASVVHVRRLLVERRESGTSPVANGPRVSVLPPPERGPAGVGLRPPAAVSIIIPTRDRVDLLAPCVAGLLERTRLPERIELILVDNGSRGRRIRRLYDRLSPDPRVRVLDRPGPFNFSFLCNEGAAAATGDVLVFLNNDVDVIDPDWLGALTSRCRDPDVGAVGGRLTYPGGDRVQHDGVVLGIGGFAGHVYARRPRAAWDLDDDAPRRVSAVTGACLAVERRKFDAVGGFDAADLPVDLSDVDLCLKLDEAGWGSILVPAARLIHRESASRGDALKPFTRYGRERRVFRERWAERLADDPYFHPALSLFSRDARLG